MAFTAVSFLDSHPQKSKNLNFEIDGLNVNYHLIFGIDKLQLNELITITGKKWPKG